MKTKLSIIVPVYNVEEYLRDCLNSILCQTFSDFELLLVDDGTPDSSGAICDEYTFYDSRIRVFHKQNGGVSSARNHGLDNAQGEWVTFIDADDIISPTFIEGLMKPTKVCRDLDLIHGGCTNWKGGAPAGINQKYDDYIGTDPAYVFENFRGLTVSKLFRLEKINHWVDGQPLRFDEKMKIAEDMAFTLDYLLTVKKYVFVTERGYYYRVDNMRSATKSQRVAPYEEELCVYRHISRSSLSYMKKFKLIFDDRKYRLSQLGEHLQNTILSLYRNNYSRKHRINYVTKDFNTDDLKLLHFVATNPIKRYIFLLAQCNIYLFDLIMFVLYKLNLVK